MNGIFAVNKPSGPSSHNIVHQLREIFAKSPLFEADIRKVKKMQQSRTPRFKKFRKDRLPLIKVGHGGTLDPLADGVLVIGVGEGTKQLSDYLGNCTKVYQATALLGVTTDTYDSEGKIIGVGNTDNITDEMIENLLPKFRGDILQTPPIFSALKMDGKKLYEYARSGNPLPREIEQRKVTIHEFDIVGKGLNWDHTYKVPGMFAPQDVKDLSVEFETKTIQTKGFPPVNISYDYNELPDQYKTGPIVEIKFSVSSGTYIRTIIHDLGLALGCGAHMVKLTRLQQAQWKLGYNTFNLEDFGKSEEVWGPPLKYYLASDSNVAIDSLFPASVKEEAEIKEEPRAVEAKESSATVVESQSTPALANETLAAASSVNEEPAVEEDTQATPPVSIEGEILKQQD